MKGFCLRSFVLGVSQICKDLTVMVYSGIKRGNSP